MNESEFRLFFARQLVSRRHEITQGHKKITLSVPEQFESELVNFAFSLRERHKRETISRMETEEKERFEFVRVNEAAGHHFASNAPPRRSWNFNKLPQTIVCKNKQEAIKIQNNALAAAHRRGVKIKTQIQGDMNVLITVP